jgi:hypothetical protein
MKRILLTLLTLACAATLSAAQLIVPAAGAGAGARGSQWQSDVTIHNAALTPASLTFSFHDSDGLVASFPFTVAARETVTITDIVASAFGVSTLSGAVTGAIVIEADEITLLKLAVTSRTFATSEAGEFGQDIPALTPAAAAGTGDTAVLAGPSEVSGSRFNFGLYTLEASTVEWVLVRSTGDIGATVDSEYDANVQVQYNRGIQTLLAAQPAPDDVVYARVLSGSVIAYGSIVNNASNDPGFVPAFRTRENFPAKLLGIDLNEDGNIDIPANADGVLESPVPLRASHGFPNYFRIVVVDPEGAEVHLELVDPPSDVRLLDGGTVRWFPVGSLSGTSGALIVSASDGFAETRFLIPVTFH